MIIFFVWVAWIRVVITVLADVLRRRDVSGWWGKAGWTIVVIVIPFLGVLVYLIAQGTGMTERSAQFSPSRPDRIQEIRPQDRPARAPAASEIEK